MNAILLSPVDALVVDYFALGIFTVVNNLWTWVALLTAAISFWRFKTEKNKPVCMNRAESKSDPVETTAFKCCGSDSEVASTSGSATTTLVTNCHVNGWEDDGVTKGKFFTYYYEERVETVDECSCDGNGDETVVEGAGWWPERLLVRMKMEEMGWYGGQDLTVVNGSVVRLWEEKTEDRSGCGVW